MKVKYSGCVIVYAHMEFLQASEETRSLTLHSILTEINPVGGGRRQEVHTRPRWPKLRPLKSINNVCHRNNEAGIKIFQFDKDRLK
jgi:hypothetical protein